MQYDRLLAKVQEMIGAKNILKVHACRRTRNYYEKTSRRQPNHAAVRLAEIAWNFWGDNGFVHIARTSL